jgi:phenylacetate-coenzyme A ligase PaaK-like adenylate-forming protein
MTECSCWGVSCPSQQGVHIFEDLGLMEVVDERHRPVPDGVSGAKVLMTNLYNFTQPLIRYEVTDLITISKGPCPCGSPFRLISRLSGREEDILFLTGVRGQAVAVAPAQFRLALEKSGAIVEYQLVQEGQDRLRLRLVLHGGTAPGPMARQVAGQFKALWKKLGIRPPQLGVDFAHRIEREPTGKLKSIKSCLRGVP